LIVAIATAAALVVFSPPDKLNDRFFAWLWHLPLSMISRSPAIGSMALSISLYLATALIHRPPLRRGDHVVFRSHFSPR
jgi:hypothetical protein